MEQQELLKQFEANHQGSQPGLVQRIGHRVKTAAQWIKTHTQPEPSEPCFDGS